MSATRRLRTVPGSSFLDPDSESSNFYEVVQHEESPIIWMSESGKLAMQYTMQNSLVVQKILHHLNYQDILQGRRVNSLWNAISTKIMRKRDCCIIAFKNCSIRKEYHQGLSSQLTTRQFTPSQYLTDLNKILQQSSSLTSLPCTDFMFYGGDLLEPNSSSRLFFEDHGERIKSLQLIQIGEPLSIPETFLSRSSQSKIPFTSKTSFIEILLLYSPNLEKLSVHGFDYDDLDIEDQINLPILQQLSISSYSCHNIINLILKSAPILQVIQGQVDDHQLRTILDCKRGHCVTGLEVSGQSQEKDIVELSSCLPKISKIVFIFGPLIPSNEGLYGSMTMAIQNLLECSKHSLQYLQLGDLPFIYPRVELPIMPKLKELKLGTFINKKVCLPVQIDFNVTFPNLIFVDFTSLSCSSLSEWNTHFPSPQCDTIVLCSIETIKIPTDCCAEVLAKFESLCPNFKNLVLDYLKKFELSTILCKIFKVWTKFLETIEIRLGPLTDTADLELPIPTRPRRRGGGQQPEREQRLLPNLSNLDPCFTGMAKGTCERLKELEGFSASFDSEESFGFLPTEPSLTNLTALKTLRFVIILPFKVEFIPFSFLSGKYAFQRVPGLEVILQVNRKWHNNHVNNPRYANLVPYINTFDFQVPKIQ